MLSNQLGKKSKSQTRVNMPGKEAADEESRNEDRRSPPCDRTRIRKRNIFSIMFPIYKHGKIPNPRTRPTKRAGQDHYTPTSTGRLDSLPSNLIEVDDQQRIDDVRRWVMNQSRQAHLWRVKILGIPPNEEPLLVAHPQPRNQTALDLSAQKKEGLRSPSKATRRSLRLKTSAQQALDEDSERRMCDCVMCETSCNNVDRHATARHGKGHGVCYEASRFDGKDVYAPKNAVRNDELASCSVCHSVFFEHRVGNHACGRPSNASIDEGRGGEYCLLCQLRCDKVEEHWKNVHNDNKAYKVEEKRGMQCLVPTHLDDDEVCDARFVFKHRVFRHFL